MSESDDDEDDGFEVGVEPPGCAQLAEGDLYIPSVDEFAEEIGAKALQLRDGVLFYLDEAFKWVNVEELGKAKAEKPKSATLRAIKGKPE